MSNITIEIGPQLAQTLRLFAYAIVVGLSLYGVLRRETSIPNSILFGLDLDTLNLVKLFRKDDNADKSKTS